MPISAKMPIVSRHEKTYAISRQSKLMGACISLAFALVRIQPCPAFHSDPFRVNNFATQLLYDSVQLVGLHSTEVIVTGFDD